MRYCARFPKSQIILKKVCLFIGDWAYDIGYGELNHVLSTGDV